MQNLVLAISLEQIDEPPFPFRRERNIRVPAAEGGKVEARVLRDLGGVRRCVGSFGIAAFVSTNGRGIADLALGLQEELTLEHEEDAKLVVPLCDL